MSLDPKERLAALRREVLAETPPTTAAASSHASGPPVAAPASAPADRAAPASAPPAGAVPAATVLPPDPAPSATTPKASTPNADSDTGHGWDLQELLADTSLSTWLGVGLLGLGGYLVLSWFVPGIDLIGSLLLLGAGLVLLVQHLQRGAGAWALYAGALLTGVGAGRAVGDILPGSPHGLTAMGVGCAFLALGYLRHGQAGGYGWQGTVGGVALGLGLIQLVLGLLPGSPGVIDLILPALLLGGGVLLLVRAGGRSTRT